MSGQLETLWLCMCDKDIWVNYVIAISGTRVDGKQEHNIKTFAHAPKQTLKRFLVPTSLNPSRYGETAIAAATATNNKSNKKKPNE